MLYIFFCFLQAFQLSSQAHMHAIADLPRVWTVFIINMLGPILDEIPHFEDLQIGERDRRHSYQTSHEVETMITCYV